MSTYHVSNRHRYATKSDVRELPTIFLYNEFEAIKNTLSKSCESDYGNDVTIELLNSMTLRRKYTYRPWDGSINYCLTRKLPDGAKINYCSRADHTKSS